MRRFGLCAVAVVDAQESVTVAVYYTMVPPGNCT
jgi:hypothetical protein